MHYFVILYNHKDRNLCAQNSFENENGSERSIEQTKIEDGKEFHNEISHDVLYLM